ncbi:nucleoside recognition domain-containing protein [Saccharibacillus alkalitolerans]|uniref:Ferrous iron transporter B n=1 Tax=Saccharibacillus alkalitolerans TaxID=2705290 RepID=A0ABX0FAN7_9BACL|nr:nucleoside recognition domain-containing protein [Saccharibacillus alkalitolerans]NGZ77104.1 ferrous iron transporter B [Saccharibacillus alkalitolerans]
MLNRMRIEEESRRSVVLIGFESSGKSALFRGLTGRDTGEEANFRGSTVTARRAFLEEERELVDLPGIKGGDDSRTTRDALSELGSADTVVLVVRGSHSALELPLLLEAVPLEGRRAMLILTFADKAPEGLSELERHYGRSLGIPVHSVDARGIEPARRKRLLRSLGEARPLRRTQGQLAPPIVANRLAEPSRTWFEHRFGGRPLALAASILLFAVPVLLAYLLSNGLQPLADRYAIDPVKSWFAGLPPLPEAIFAGDYGVLTLGLYSFLWAFPVVLLLGISLALTEESGLKDRITDALDPWMRRIGLNGRDLLPVLSGFGCNVVAVFQSRACGACSRKSCVSLIAFGSACSYQIGASLSIFGSAGHPWLFIPYIALLAIVGAVHTRLWNRGAAYLPQAGYSPKTFLQMPGLRAVNWRIRGVVKQFLFQAMPIFLGICAAAALLQWSGLMNLLSGAAAPLLELLNLPAEAAGGVLFSILRKDGLLMPNQGEGSLLRTMSTGQIFMLVYLASTLTACLVTLWTVRRELGWKFASSLAGKQVATSIVTTAVLALLFSLS